MKKPYTTVVYGDGSFEKKGLLSIVCSRYILQLSQFFFGTALNGPAAAAAFSLLTPFPHSLSLSCWAILMGAPYTPLQSSSRYVGREGE